LRFAARGDHSLGSVAVTVDRRQINDDRRRVFGDARELIAFVCECDDEQCARTVPLGPADFDRIRAGEDDRILAPAHRVDAPG
jgi:hypothetical protein